MKCVPGVNLPSECFCEGEDPLPYLSLNQLLDQMSKRDTVFLGRIGIISREMESWKYQDHEITIKMAFLRERITLGPPTLYPSFAEVKHNGKQIKIAFSISRAQHFIMGIEYFYKEKTRYKSMNAFEKRLICI